MLLKPRRSARYCAMLAIDITAFGRRDDRLQRCMREALYRIVDNACQIAGIPTAICHCEDRGDGILLIAPPCVPAETLLDTLTNHLRAGLRQHNKVTRAEAMLRLRMAIHAGHVAFDPNGAYGTAVTRMFRMLEAPQVKSVAANAELAVVTSDHLYDEVIRHAPGLIDPTVYQPITITLKETQVQGWVWLTRPTPRRSTGRARRSRPVRGGFAYSSSPPGYRHISPTLIYRRDTPRFCVSTAYARVYGKIFAMSVRRGSGAVRGRRQRGNSVPRSVKSAKPGELIATGFRLEFNEYMKAHTAAEAAGLSLSGYFAELVRRDEVDERGRPTWAEPVPEQLDAGNAEEPAA